MSSVHFFSLRMNKHNIVFSVDQEFQCDFHIPFHSSSLRLENMMVNNWEYVSRYIDVVLQKNNFEETLEAWNNGNNFATIAIVIDDILIIPDLCMNLTSFATPPSEVSKLYEKVRLSLELHTRRQIKGLEFCNKWVAKQEQASQKWNATIEQLQI